MILINEMHLIGASNILEVAVCDYSTVISSAASVIAIAGAVVAYLKWKDAKKVERANRLYSVVNLLRADESIRQVMYNIDYGKHWYVSASEGICIACTKTGDQYYSTKVSNNSLNGHKRWL